jgi:hypothetical protein
LVDGTKVLRWDLVTGEGDLMVNVTRIYISEAKLSLAVPKAFKFGFAKVFPLDLILKRVQMFTGLVRGIFQPFLEYTPIVGPVPSTVLVEVALCRAVPHLASILNARFRLI